MSLIYAVLLLLLFYFLLVLEFFLPTGGMIGAAALAALVASVLVAFSHSVAAGVTILLIALATTPIIFLMMVRIWPHTPIGRRMLNRRPGELKEIVPKRTSRGTPLEELVGRIGIAKTDLLPSGLVTIDSQKLDAVSIGMPIDAGSRVIVTKTDTGKIHVRAALDDESEDEAEEPRSPASLEFDLE